MRVRAFTVLSGGAILVVFLLRGCASPTAGGAGGGGGAGGNGGGQSSADETTVEVSLSPAARTFVVEGGEPVQHTDTASVELPGRRIRGGTISIPPSGITFTPTVEGKGVTTLQSATVILVTVWIAPLDQLDQSCGVGEPYGPFSITLDEGGTPIDVQPPSAPLTQNTINLLDEFVLCIDVNAPGVSATIDIATLTLNLDTEVSSSDPGGSSCVTPGDCPDGFACHDGVCVDSRDDPDDRPEVFPNCATDTVNVDPGDIFCRSDADCLDGSRCCTSDEICGSNPCTCGH